MLKVIGFGLATGAGIQAWRQWPADGPVTVRAGVLVFVVGVVCAYLGGRWHGRRHGSSSAVAVAHAEAQATATAQQSVQVAFFVPGQGAGTSATRVPDEAVEWFGGERRQVEASELDGMDLSELVEQEHPETVT